MVDKPSRKQLQKIHREISRYNNLDPRTGYQSTKANSSEYDDDPRPSDISKPERDARYDLAFGHITEEEFNILKENNWNV